MKNKFEPPYVTDQPTFDPSRPGRAQLYAPADSIWLKALDKLNLALPKTMRFPHNVPQSFDLPLDIYDLPKTPRALIWKQIKMQKWPYLFSLFVSTLMRLSGICVPLILGKMLNDGLAEGFNSNFAFWFLMLVINVLVIGLAWALDQIANMNLAWRMSWWQSFNLTSRTIDRAIPMTKQVSSGNLVASTMVDSGAIADLLLFLPALTASLITMLVSGAIMLSYSIPLGLLVLLGLPAATLLVSSTAKPLRRRTDEARGALGQLNTVATDAVMGLRVLRGIGGEDKYTAHYQEASRDLTEKGMKVVVFRALMATLRAGMPALFQTTIIAVGAYMVWNGSLTAGTLLAFFGLSTYLQSSVNSIVTAAMVITGAQVAAARICQMTVVEPNLTDQATKESPSSWNAVSFQDMASGAKLHGGQITAVVCENPEVSTALVRRLARLEDGTEVQLQGGDLCGAKQVKLADLPIEGVRDAVLFSSGEAGVFAGSLRKSLLGRKAVANPPLTLPELLAWDAIERSPESEFLLLPDHQPTDWDDQLLAAIEVANANDVLTSLGGLDGRILEKGRNLSGGQRQRLALARAVAADSPVLLLSHPTSAQDANTEATIGQSLAQNRAGRTTVIATASPLLIHTVDQVLVLAEDGHALGGGTPSQFASGQVNDQALAAFARVIEQATSEVNDKPSENDYDEEVGR
ncbi:hypothetical protein BK816_00250 [Boudabousia tangfeifanii]|uniref:Uncharacterized protein n=1 Tax=Boudabousia tangfeifanii TaxID=1912795 RepID=A0A1D9MI78_9ACTO|nr:ABC transporter ATP-binding protein [Boudabousia tangfeifanii]AOZ71913.1 hypothetical protein BK816_00250 [Boudabousia tangfeifanii]